MHGYLLVRSEEGKVIGTGEFIQMTNGYRAHSKVIFRFFDGSVDEEESTFLQRNVLQLVSDHHIQQGRSFPQPINVEINVPESKVTWRERKDKETETKIQHMDLPSDLMNGMLSPLFINVAPGAPETTVSYLSSGSKPRLIKLVIKPAGQETFTIGSRKHHATRYNIHPELGGVAGVIAPMIGKQPSDMYAYVIGGEVPMFAKLQGSFYEGGPVWTVELTSPAWPTGPEVSRVSGRPAAVQTF